MKTVTFENYKAFARGEMELRPLTLLLGANSSGKSSILHLFLMLEQTINNSENYSSALKTNGHSVNLGEDVNLLKDRNRSQPLALEFGIEPNRFLENVKEQFQVYIRQVCVGFLLYVGEVSPEQLPGVFSEMEKYGDDILKMDIRSITRTFTNFHDSLVRSLFRHNEDRVQELGKQWNGITDIGLMKRIFDALYNCIGDFESAFPSGANKSSIRFEFHLGKTSRRIRVRSCHVRIDDRFPLVITINGNNALIQSDLFDEQSLRLLCETFHPQFCFNGLGIKTKNNDVFSNFLALIVEQAYSPVQSFFSKQKLKYVGPLRAYPQRYYFLDESNTNQQLDSRNGSSLAEVLKKNATVKDRINKWLDIFGFSIDVKEFKDVIHNIKVKQNELLLDIPDVGFGVSQVLPILVEGFMAPQDSTIIMEQPEIHLHPKMQAELADLFIDILNLKTKDKSRISKNLIIETHSEYLLKRIRRRMAEGTISPSHVAIYFVKPRNKDNPDSAQIELAHISKDGTIEWPRDFYITEMEDDLAFFASKIRKS